ncbi:MAG: hypothetical protein V2A77_04820 [Pseudomonadota bacterium]
MKYLRLLICLLPLFLPSLAGAATYYCRNIAGTLYYKMSAWPTSSDTSATDIEAIENNLLMLDVLVLASDSYSGTQLDETDGIDSVHNYQTLRAPVSTDPAYATYAGPVVIDGTGINDHIFNLNYNGACLQGLTIINGSNNNYALRITGTTTGQQYIDCIFENNRQDVYCSGGNPVFTRCIFSDTVQTNSWQITGGTPTLNYCIMERAGRINVTDNVRFLAVSCG